MHWETVVFALAAAYNLGIIVVSKGFTSKDLFDFDPLFNRNGCIGVVLWGLAYGSMATTFESAPYICAVFAVEKWFYYVHWHAWLHSAADVSRAGSAEFFYRTYGIGDLLFGSFFWYVFGHSTVLANGGSDGVAVPLGVGLAAAGALVPVASMLVYLARKGSQPPMLQMNP